MSFAGYVLLLVGGFLLLMVLGVPIAFSLSISAIFTVLVTGNFTVTAIFHRMVGNASGYTLLAIPFFILAAKMMNTGGVTRKIFRACSAWVGSIPGGLGHANIVASIVFSGMSGSAVADAGGLGQIEVDAMNKEGFDPEFSAAVTAASATIGPIIPPSTIMIVYGVTAEVSISRLFLGGVIPGIMIAVAEMGMVYWYAVRRNYPKGDRFSLKRLWKEFRASFLSLLTVVVILGGILGGIFTATEAGAFAALYALLISVFVYKELTWKQVWEIMCDTAKQSGCILMLVGTASIFGWCLTYEQAPQKVANLLVSLTENKTVILLLFALAYVFLGMIMEATAIIVTTVPIVVPLFKLLGIDLVYFGVLCCIIMSLGTITPPVGTCMFVLCKMTKTPIQQFTKAILPWLGLLLVIIVLLVLFPGLITALPNLLFG